MESVLIHPNDNVEVRLSDGHKYAVRKIAAGEPVVKYGFPIGTATRDIAPGARVHTDNLKTALSGVQSYAYHPKASPVQPTAPATIKAYVRKNGDVGIRNEVWIIPTVGCVNGVAKALAAQTGAVCFAHPYGCSQLGGDLAVTQKTLCGLIKHPNAGGVLVLGLGCENNGIDAMKAALGDYDEARIRFLNCQDCGDELAAGKQILAELKALAATDVRTEVPVSKLRLGLKCGGSDGLSGITANPLCGRVTDHLISMGGTAVLTEVPEMFGAEQVLFDRCVSEAVFDSAVRLINDYKQYFIAHGQPVSENPSPGNKAGGITTLEEKSLGCVQKGGAAPVTAVLDYGDKAETAGLNLLNGPGNDMVAVTNLAAAGCQLILFTTGRGTPLGAPVPTVKIATNSALAKKKRAWIDFDAQSQTADDLFHLLLDTANGRKTKNERNDFREIAIFKDGVTL
ncbi:MAG: altronate dehydratase [Clostridia bacterium]|nr:altronate dehydratase [Clostridia bacterium]